MYTLKALNHNCFRVAGDNGSLSHFPMVSQGELGYEEKKTKTFHTCTYVKFDKFKHSPAVGENEKNIYVQFISSHILK